MIVTLPWPDKRLSPNARVHWAGLARVKRDARRAAFWLTIETRPQPDFAGDLAITMTFHPPDNRTRDGDNLIAQMKAYLDGIAQAMGVNDSTFKLQPIAFGAVEKPGRVTVEIVAARYRDDP